MSQDPSDPRWVLQRNVERLLRSLVYQRHPATHFSEPSWSPPVDLVVAEHTARVIVELAGVPREAVRVRLQGRALEISGRREPPREVGDARYQMAEILFGDFHRIVELPWNAEADSVEALFREGMLEVRLKRATPEPHAEIRVEPHRNE